MSVLYFKVLSDYYHHVIGDLEEDKRKFLENLHKFILADDEYGYPPDLSGMIGRSEYMLKKISMGSQGMDIEEYLTLKKWYKEDGWSDGEIDEYFLYFKKGQEVNIIYDIHSLTSDEIVFLKHLDSFLENKGKILKAFNPHNGKYQKISYFLK